MWKYTGKERPDFAESPKDGEESVWDYPRPPKCAPDARRIVVKLGSTVIADTKNAVRVLETASPPTIYIPPSDIDLTKLQQASGSSFCEWKGRASYWNIAADGKVVPNGGWSYASPSGSFLQIKNYLSFYPALLDCFIDDEQVRPQAGGFYGGWVTNEIIGPHKGEPGTSGW